MGDSAFDVGNDLERSAGFLRGIAFYLKHEGDRSSARLPEDPAEHEQYEMRGWLFAVMVEAIEREADKLEALAGRVSQLERGGAEPPPGKPPLTLVPGGSVAG